jgi:hypothetical protein
MSSPQSALSPSYPDSPETANGVRSSLIDATLLLAVLTGLLYFVGAARILIARGILGLTTFSLPPKEECLMSGVLTILGSVQSGLVWIIFVLAVSVMAPILLTKFGARVKRVEACFVAAAILAVVLIPVCVLISLPAHVFDQLNLADLRALTPEVSHNFEVGAALGAWAVASMTAFLYASLKEGYGASHTQHGGITRYPPVRGHLRLATLLVGLASFVVTATQIGAAEASRDIHRPFAIVKIAGSPLVDQNETLLLLDSDDKSVAALSRSPTVSVICVPRADIKRISITTESMKMEQYLRLHDQ